MQGAPVFLAVICSTSRRIHHLWCHCFHPADQECIAQAFAHTLACPDCTVTCPVQVPSLRASSLDRVLLSIIRATDDLSLAADSLLDLTAASDPSTNTTLIPASAPAPSTALPAAPTLQLNSVLQPVPVLQLSAHETHEAHASTAGQQELSTPQRMSQQALAMAVEALKLATLLEAQADGCDPAEQELLQQIAAAARLVSVMAADIVPAPRPQAADSNSGRGDLAPAGSMHGGGSSAALAAAPENAPAEAAGAAGAAAGSVSGNALPRFAGLPVLGIQQEACHTPDEVAAAALKSLTCLHL